MTTEVQIEQNAAKEVAKHSLSIETAISAINGAMVMGRKALNTELAVCLAIFAAEGNSEANTKGMVVEVYVKAGYKAENSTAPHYKTVNRRVNAAAGLFNMVGSEQVLEWIGKSQEEKMISSILKGLDTYEFNSMDDVLEFCGRPNNRTQKQNAQANQGDNQGAQAADNKDADTNQGEAGANDDKKPGDEGGDKAQEQQAAPKGGKQPVQMHVYRVPGAKVELPEDLSSEILLKLAAKLISAARAKEQAELAAAIAHPSTAPNVAPAVLH